MGTYNILTKDIIEALDDALDILQGDFTEKQLLKALKYMKLYPFVSDKRKSIATYRQARLKFTQT